MINMNIMFWTVKKTSNLEKTNGRKWLNQIIKVQ